MRARGLRKPPSTSLSERCVHPENKRGCNACGRLLDGWVLQVQDALVAEDERSRAILPPTSHVASFDAIRSVLLRENTAAILSSNAGTTAQLLSLLRDASSIARDDVRRDSRVRVPGVCCRAPFVRM